MNPAFTPIEALLASGDLNGAGDEYAKLRSGFKSSMDGLTLAARIHAAANRWDQVGVLSRVMRNEFPSEVRGYELGVESLSEQGRHDDANNLLNSWDGGATGRCMIENVLARYRPVNQDSR